MKSKKTIVLLITVMLVIFSSFTTMAKTVAKIGGTSYSSLQKAADAVKKGQTIKLVSDVKLNSDIDFQKKTKYTLNLNKHKIHTKTWYSVRISAGSVTIKNGTVYAPIRIREKASVTVTSGTYKRRKGDSGNILFDNSGKLTIKGGSFNGSSTAVGKKSSLKITGGKFSCTESASMPFNTRDGCKATISGGSFKGDVSNGGTMTISGGTFTSISNSGGKLTIKKAKVNGCVINTGGTMTIKNGTFHYDGMQHSSDTKSSDHTTLVIFSGKVTILGGTFTNKYCSVINLHHKNTNVWGSNLSDETHLIVKGGSIRTTSVNETPVTMSKEVKDKVKLTLNYKAFPGVPADKVVDYL